MIFKKKFNKIKNKKFNYNFFNFFLFFFFEKIINFILVIMKLDYNKILSNNEINICYFKLEFILFGKYYKEHIRFHYKYLKEHIIDFELFDMFKPYYSTNKYIKINLFINKRCNKIILHLKIFINSKNYYKELIFKQNKSHKNQYFILNKDDQLNDIKVIKSSLIFI